MENSQKKWMPFDSSSIPKTLEEFEELIREKNSSPDEAEKGEEMVTYEVKFVSNRRDRNN